MPEFDINSLQNLLNDRIESEVDSIKTEGVIGAATKFVAGTAGSLIGGKIENNIKYKFDNKIKKEIVKKVKLEVKLNKLDKANKLSKEDKNKLKDEIKMYQKNIDKYFNSLDDNDTKEDVKNFIKKCEVDYGPKSLYYFSIRVPKNLKESTEDILFIDYIDESYIKESDNSAVIDEFNIGTMLPQCGSTDGVGDPRSITKIINKTNNEIEEEDENLLSDDSELDSVMINYINNPDDVYDEVVDESVKDFANRAVNKVKITVSMRKLLTQRALLKTKLYIARKKSNNTIKINEIKRDLISKENEIRELKRGLPTQTINEINKLSNQIEKEMKAQDKNFNDNIPIDYKESSNDEKNENNINDNNQSNNENNDSSVNDNDKTNSSSSSSEQDMNKEKDTKESYQMKLEAAQERNDIDAIRVYENKLKWLKLHENDPVDIMIEAANIEDDIKPIIELLNSKGYKTKYSSSGHTKLRKKSDNDRNGVYYDKLYSDARIMFDDNYNFPKAPKYWVWKTVEGKDYLDIIPIRYDKKDGTPQEAFSKWKAKYMGTLKTWADNLPEQNKSDDKAIITDKKGRTLTTESFNQEDINSDYQQYFENTINEFFDDLNIK